MPIRNHARTRVVCRHRNDATFCLFIEQQVHPDVACSPAPAGSGGGEAPCGCFASLDVAALQRRANDQVRKGGWGKWAKQGAIVVEL
jgi:hypothetical protein